MAAISTTATGGKGGSSVNVTLTNKDVVVAPLPVRKQWLPLSNIDLTVPHVYVDVFFCYKKNYTDNSVINDYGTATFNILKKALAEAIATYYAFGGEVVTNSVGEPELLCNNRGVDFVEAIADVELRHLDLYDPDYTIGGNFISKIKQGVLSVQATKLKCGGLVVACTFDHRIADAYSANMFLVTWAELAQSKPVLSLPPPTFERSLLSPRHPRSHILPSLVDMYITVPLSSDPKDITILAAASAVTKSESINVEEKEEEEEVVFVSHMYYVTAESIAQLQSLASSGTSRRTRLESFSAFLWKTVAECAGEDMKCGLKNKTAKMGIVVDGRTRLGKNGTSMTSYFGNVLLLPYGVHDMAELREMPLCHVADSVHDFVQAAATKEHFMGLVDWVEAHRPEPTRAKIYCTGSDEGPAFVVSSGQRFPVKEMDFGWGKPVFGSYYFPWDGDSGYVMPVPSAARDGDWVVYVRLCKPHLDRLENRAAAVLKPLVSDYLNL